MRYFGEVNADAASVRKLVARLEKRHGKLHFCYEAGPTGYRLYRQIIALGHECSVVAPSLIPRKPGDRIKTNRRDALQLARLLRAGELTAVWEPDEAHEAIRELIRSRAAAAMTRWADGSLAMMVGIIPAEWRPTPTQRMVEGFEADRRRQFGHLPFFGHSEKLQGSGGLSPAAVAALGAAVPD